MNKNTRIGFGRRIKRGLLALAMTTGIVGGMTVAMASPASANEYTVYYPVQMWQACQLQGHTTAGTFTPYNPYSGFCYDVSIPAGVTFAGNVDMQAYCDKKYPGAVAVVDGNTVFDWKCKRVENPWSS